jgi:hypothetical protein
MNTDPEHHHGNHDPEAALSDNHNALSVSNHEEAIHYDNEKQKKKIEESPRSMNWRGSANSDSIPLTHSPPPHSENKGQSGHGKAPSTVTPAPRLLHP